VRPPTTQSPRRPIGAGGVRGGSRSGSLSVVTTHALFARKVQRKVSNGVAAFAARGSSLIGKNRGNFRLISAMQIDDQRLREDARGMPTLGQLRTSGHRSSNANGRVAGIRLDSHRSIRAFNGIICDEISEFEALDGVSSLREYFRRSRGLSAVRCVGKGDVAASYWSFRH
jgi:hypothetical protein